MAVFHNPQPLLRSLSEDHLSPVGRKRARPVKFRCERDVLVEALNTAGRAASSRGGSPVLSGVRLELKGGGLSATGTDLDLTITTSVEVDGRSDGVAVLPSKLATDIVKALEPGAVSVEVGGDEA